MEIFETGQTREEYFSIQISRSKEKFQYCKFSVHDAIKYNFMVRKHLELPLGKQQPTVVCMGTRNGKEIDLFRLASTRPYLAGLFRLTEIGRKGFRALFDPLFLSLGRCVLEHFERGGFFGVEINPMARRSDVYIGSFDELPDNWENQVDIIYSNSFDQSQDPYRTAREWSRVLAENGILIFAGNFDQVPSGHDPVGKMTLDDVLGIFPGDLIYYDHHGSRNNYTEVVIRMAG